MNAVECFWKLENAALSNFNSLRWFGVNTSDLSKDRVQMYLHYPNTLKIVGKGS